jgi:hypothetical protein
VGQSVQRHDRSRAGFGLTAPGGPDGRPPTSNIALRRVYELRVALKDFSLDKKMDLFSEVHFLMLGAGNETGIRACGIPTNLLQRLRLLTYLVSQRVLKSLQTY